MERLFMTKRNEFLLKINNRISNILLAVAVFIGVLSNPVIANAASTIFCPECGKQIDANSKYCMFCACQIEQYLLKDSFDPHADERMNIPQYTIAGTTLTVSGTKVICPRDHIANWETEKKKITRVVIENGAEEISVSAFGMCSNLEEIELPESVRTIGASAFLGCSNLRRIIIPEGVKAIEGETFYHCESLESIELPDSITSIGKYAFWACKNLKYISLPIRLTQIGNSAFSSCGLLRISLPDSLKQVGDGIFSGCDKLKNITISSSQPILELRDGALFDKNERRLIYVPVSMVGEYYVPVGTKTIGGYAFWSCKQIEKIIIPDSVSTIGASAFGFCNKLIEITIPDSVISIGEDAFQAASSKLVAKVGNGSYAKRYCENYGISISSELNANHKNIEKDTTEEELNRLATTYYEGNGVEQDYEKAFTYWERSAAMGNMDAQFRVGFCYFYGIGVKQDYSNAAVWFTKAAEQGEKGAQYNLGVMYENGIGVRQDYVKAVQYYQISADQGNEFAQCNLAYCYLNGIGIKKDVKLAIHWYEVAAGQGNELAKESLNKLFASEEGTTYSNGLEVFSAEGFIKLMIDTMNSSHSLEKLPFEPHFSYLQSEDDYIVYYEDINLQRITMWANGNKVSGKAKFDSIVIECPCSVYEDMLCMINSCVAATVLTSSSDYNDAGKFYQELLTTADGTNDGEYFHASMQKEGLIYSVEGNVIDKEKDSWYYVYSITE